MTRKEKLIRRLDEVDRRRRDLLEELEELDEAQLAAHPIPDKWSILEIVEHLVLAEEAFLKALDKVRQGEGLRRRTLKDVVLYQVVMLVLRFPIPVRVPAQSMVPEGDADFRDLRSRWDENHRRLRDFAESLDPEDLNEPVASHPVAGPMKPGQGVAMLDVHLRRHRGQIDERIELLSEG